MAHRAEVARLRGEFDTAQSIFRRAAAALRAKGDDEGEADALHSLATIARRQGDCDAAFKYLDRAVELTKPESAVRTKCGNTRGLCFVSLGEWTAAEREFRVALQSAEERNDEHHIRLITHNLGLPAMMRGDFGEALHWLRRMLRTDGHEAPIPQEAWAHLNIARCHLYRGEMEECERHLDLALERCQLFNLVGQQGEAFEAYGNLYRERGELTRAAEFYERAARAYEEAGIDQSRVELFEEQALLSLKAGDLARARGQIDRLIELRSARNDEAGAFTATLAHARIRIAAREFEAAREELVPALEYFRPRGLHYYEAQACIDLATCESELGHEPQMLEYLRRVMDLAARLRLRLLAASGNCASPVAVRFGSGAGNSARRFARSGSRSRNGVAATRDGGRLDARAPRRSDHKHAGTGRDLPRSGPAFCGRCVDDPPRPRHSVLHRLATSPSRAKRHDHRHVLD